MTILVVGGAGFIGSTLVKRLCLQKKRVIVVDKLSLGSEDYLKGADIKFYKEDINNLEKILHILSSESINEVWHLAANSDIPSGVLDMQVDLKDTFMTTISVLTLMKKINCKKLYFASSSAIYGFKKERLHEDIGPLLPISNYGAMKLSSEAVISAAAESFLEKICVYRFPNVVGVPATHGVILDFIRKLKNTPDSLDVLGNGTQQKTYIHVSELIDAMLFINSNTGKGLNVFNIGPRDNGVNVSQIAKEVVDVVSPNAQIYYGESDRGWIGDVPTFLYSVDKLLSLGWEPKMSSLQAIKKSVKEIFKQENS